ncbi:MAG: class I SAM-dependent methyltransferase [Acidobacteriota bacterium]
MTPKPTSFDGQAAEFDRRAGLPEEDCRGIAAAVLSLTGVNEGDRVVEIGAGTGIMGRWFLDHPVRYTGLDLSLDMLGVFRRRAAGARLVQANGADRWPFPDGSVSAVFSSRAIHLLPLDHVVEELFRVGLPGAALVLGWVEREPESVKARMSREMQRRLRERGFPARTAGSRRVLQACREQGAGDLPKTVVARWPARHTARQSLDDWRSKEGLGGLVLPPGVQEEVLTELETWAVEAFGGLDAARETEDAYVLEGARLHG